MQEKAFEGGRVHTSDEEEIRRLNTYWRAANYISVGQIYLMDNPLLREPLRPEHIKPHPHGISAADFDGLFTRDRPVVFAYHGYPYLIHRLTYKRWNHDNIHVCGFIEEGTTTTPFDMAVLNRLDRFHLAMDVIERVPGLDSRAAHAKQHFRDKLIEHRHYVDERGEDMPEIQDWSWPCKTAAQAGD